MSEQRIDPSSRRGGRIRKVWYTARCIAAASFGASMASATFTHPSAFYLPDQFSDEAPDGARQRIVELARELRATAPEAVEVFDIPAYAAATDVQQARVKEFQQQVRAAYVTALAHQIAGDPELASTARRIVSAWAGTHRRIAGTDGPVVMNYLGVGLLLACDLAWASFSPAEIVQIRHWARTVLLRQAVAPELRRHRNNHLSWAIFAGLVAAFTLDDRELFDSYARLLDLHIGTAIAPDGRMPLELARGTRAGWYTYFGLAPILAGVQVVQNVSGEQLWDAHDKRIEKAIRYLYQTYSAPDTLGAGSGVNPENLFEAASGAYPRQLWADEDYLGKVRPIDASNDQHVAWEFPTAFKARRGRGAAPPR